MKASAFRDMLIRSNLRWSHDHDIAMYMAIFMAEGGQMTDETFADVAREMLARRPTCKHETWDDVMAIGKGVVARLCKNCGLEMPPEGMSEYP